MTKKLYILLAVSLIFIGCNREQDQFENDFYHSLNKASHQTVSKFDLSEITHFEWDEMILLTGNESVPIFVKEITPLIPEENEELPVDFDRFYFFLNNKLIKKFDLFNDYHAQQYYLENCGNIKLKKLDCIFRMKSNTKNRKEGTVVLVPQCMELPKFMKENTTNIN
jgi:hypothetical protein